MRHFSRRVTNSEFHKNLIFMVLGYYLHIKTGSPRQPNEVARLVSETFIKWPALSDNTHCFSFWYVIILIDRPTTMLLNLH